MVREFFSSSDIDADMLERICFLVGHHHTYKDVDGLDHQILLEVDFLVNAGEQENDKTDIYEQTTPRAIGG